MQQEQLAAGLAQLSTASTRRDHEPAQQVAGLAARVEVLEGKATAREHVVTQARTCSADLQSAHAYAAMFPCASSNSLLSAYMETIDNAVGWFNASMMLVVRGSGP